MENVDLFRVESAVNARNSRSIREINASLYCIADMTKISQQYLLRLFSENDKRVNDSIQDSKYDAEEMRKDFENVSLLLMELISKCYAITSVKIHSTFTPPKFDIINSIALQ